MHSVECWGLTVRGKIDYCICGYGPSREEDERIQELESQLKTLQEKLERAKEAFKNLSPNRADFLAAGVSELHGWAEIAEDLKLYANAARACLAELGGEP